MVLRCSEGGTGDEAVDDPWDFADWWMKWCLVWTVCDWTGMDTWVFHERRRVDEPETVVDDITNAVACAPRCPKEGFIYDLTESFRRAGHPVPSCALLISPPTHGLPAGG